MFRQGTRTLQTHIASRVSALPDFEAHAHSPQRRQAHNSAKLPFHQGTNTVNRQSRIYSEIDDPFVGPTPISLRGKQPHLRRSSDEAPIRDFNSVRTVRSHTGTEMSGVSYAKPNFERAMNEAAIDEIVQALSPERKYDLFHALSTTPKGVNRSTSTRANVTNMVKSLCQPVQQQTRAESLFHLPPISTESHHASTTTGNLLASRYATVPLISSSTLTPQHYGLMNGLRSSLDPLLPNRFNYVSATDPESEPNKSLTEPRPRSSSNASKRKRFDSPSTATPVEPCKLPSMSTSPCKKASETPIDFHESPAEGGVILGD